MMRINRLALYGIGIRAIGRYLSVTASYMPIPSFNPILTTIVPTFKSQITAAKNQLEELERDIERGGNSTCVTYNQIFETIEEIFDPININYGIVSHLVSVKSNDDLRKAYNDIQPMVVNLTTSLYQSFIIYNAVKRILEEDSNLSETQRRVATAYYKACKLKGVDLSGEG